jgi:hypothetical protein
MGTPLSASYPAAGVPNGIAATAMIWHHTASQPTANRAADFIADALTPQAV